MFFKTKLEKRIAVCTIPIFLALLVPMVLLFNDKWKVIIGLIIGAILSHFRFHALAGTIKVYLSKDINSKGSVVGVVLRLFLGQLLMIIVLALALISNLTFFFGITAGILIVPLAIMVFGVLGKLGSNFTED